jgi:hypothetical protein
MPDLGHLGRKAEVLLFLERGPRAPLQEEEFPNMATIETAEALEALDECINWKLKPALDSQRVFDAVASRMRRHPAFAHLTIIQLDALLADSKREFANDMREVEWGLYTAFRCAIGGED